MRNRRFDAMRPGVMRHVTDTLENFEPRIRDRGGQRAGMDVERHRPVAIAGDHDGRHADVAITFELFP